MKLKAINTKFSKFLLSHTKGCILACTAILGFILLIISGQFKTSDYKSNTIETQSTELEQYKASLEQSLTQTVSKISGAGKSSVMITLESSFETVYASNARLDETSNDAIQSQKTTEKQLATTTNRNEGEKPIIVKKLSPKVKGVLIVCQGGNNVQIKNNIIQAAATALNIPTSRIYVTGGTFKS